MVGGGSPVANGNPWAALDQSDYYAGLMAKLPSGDAFAGVNTQYLFGAAAPTNEPLGAGGEAGSGIAQAFADVQSAASDFTEVEAVPSTTAQLLPNWEFDYGLPDTCTPLGATLQQRRHALLAKIAAVGGASEAYFIAVAAALGYTITITEGTAGSYTWTINAAAAGPTSLFRAGQSRAGDLLQRAGANAQLECVMNRIKPAHTKLLFAYS